MPTIKPLIKTLKVTASLALGWLAICQSATAQIVPDASLPTPSRVVPNGNISEIQGGTAAGGNLFHSFEDFSLPSGTEAFFNNALSVENIITRVTGGKISNINGLLRANGSANLFLLNPSGIVFGENARLDIGGSFIASTAISLQLSDGSFYSAVDPQAPPLLTINVPLGLQLGSNPGAIRVEGNGHGFTIRSIRTTPVNRSEANEGLQVPSGNTLALVGGDVNLVGGVLRAAEGQVALGSASGGEVSLAPNELGWSLGYEEVRGFRDISLSGQAALDASGSGKGSIQIVGRQVRLTDGSAGLIQNEGSQPAGDLTVNASQSLEVTGTNPEATFPSLLFNETVGDGLGGLTNITTRRLLLSAGGVIHNKNYGNGDGGDVSVSASQSLEVSGLAGSNPGIFSSLIAVTVGAGRAGDLAVDTRELTVLDGGQVAASTLSSGQAGDMTINASESVTVSGIFPVTLQPAALASATGNEGDAGTVTINTSMLVVSDGGTITTSTLANGSAGSLTINASNSVEVNGKPEGEGLTSQIGADAPIQSEAFRQALGLPDRPSGDSGELTINTSQLIVSDGARISVGNEGAGIAGNMELNVGSILLLDREGSMTAATASGEGGNINLASDLLQLRNNSQISTEAGGTGNGGNILISTDNLVALENSDIIANAQEGRGGRVVIEAQGIFGTEFRPAQTPRSDITATSALGPQFDGVVEINTPDTEPASGLAVLPANTIDPNQKIFSGCAAAAQGGSFYVTGRGGLAADPSDSIRGQTIWEDLRRFPAPQEGAALEREVEEAVAPNPQLAQLAANGERAIVEATGWKLHPDGTVELVSDRGDEKAPHLGARSSCNF